MPKGTGLVEAALAAGIEIPVFCYEPRLGPPVGACRMCLCEVAPGPPKPQAACTLTAAEGMVVKTARTSEMAAEAQNATLEFILVNHPLDCPVCDKGGECPLQDLTFRYGPGNTRMTLPEAHVREADPDLADDRARPRALHPLLPLHALLGDRSPRTASSSRSTAARGSMIATFEDEPYRAPFSGNVIELCPVGALTSTQYRFEARPWEIQNVPDRLRPLPGRLQHQRDDARGQGQADPLAQPPRGRRGLALRQGPLRVLAPARRRPDRGPAAQGRRRAASRRSAGTTRSTRPSGCCAPPAPRSSPRSPAPRRSSRPTGSAKLLRAGLGAHAAVLPEEVPDGLDSLPRAALVDPRRAGRRRPLRRAGRRARAGRRPLDQGRPPQRRPHPDRAARGAGRGRRADQRRRRARRLVRARPRRGRRLLPAAHAERPRRRRRVELRRRRRAGRRRAARCVDRSPATRPPPTRASARSPSARTP